MTTQRKHQDNQPRKAGKVPKGMSLVGKNVNKYKKEIINKDIMKSAKFLNSLND